MRKQQNKNKTKYDKMQKPAVCSMYNIQNDWNISLHICTELVKPTRFGIDGIGVAFGSPDRLME